MSFAVHLPSLTSPLVDRVIVTRRGETLVDFDSGRHSGPMALMSVTKSIVAIAVMKLFELGLIRSLDQPVREIFLEWDQGRKSQVTIRHILAHTSCLQAFRTTEEIYKSPDFVQLALCAELSGEPGSAFFYNNKAVCLLAGIVEKASGLDLETFCERHLFEPFGISDWEWDRDRAGNPHAFAGLSLGGRDLLKFGEMMLAKGQWRGRRILSEASVVELTAQGQPHDESCGLLWWRLRDQGHAVGFYASGYLGQSLVVVPEHGLVAVRQCHWDSVQRTGESALPKFNAEILALTSAPSTEAYRR